MLQSKEIVYTEEGMISVISSLVVQIKEDTIHIPKQVQASVHYALSTGENKLHIKIEEEAEIDLVCSHISQGKEETSAKIIIEHLGKKSKSSMTIKGVAKQTSSFSVIGEIIIDEKAENSEGYQQLDILMIGEEAQGKATPKLSINNPLVICSHGASVGGINKEQLFYLQSRGLNEEEAEEIIVSGFLASTGKHIKNKELHTILQEKIREEI